MRITAKVDYAVRAAAELAAHAAAHGARAPMKGEAVATAQGIPVRFLESILAELRRSGIVGSQRGSDGGYWLARPAAEVSVADIIRAVEGPLADVHGTPPEEAEYDGRGRRAAAGVDRHPGGPAGGAGGDHPRRHRLRRPARRASSTLAARPDGWARR